jgi:hypothetical protein
VVCMCGFCSVCVCVMCVCVYVCLVCMCGVCVVCVCVVCVYVCVCVCARAYLVETTSWNLLEVAWKVRPFVKWVLISCQLFCDQSIALAVYLCVKRYPTVHFEVFITWF